MEIQSIYSSMNFTLQDILGTTLAFCLFPFVLVFPGYVIGWVLGLFNFKLRSSVVKFGIGIVISFAVCPVSLDLVSSLVSYRFALNTLFFFAAAFAVILFKESTAFQAQSIRTLVPFLVICIGWSVFAVFSLINIQWGDHIYLSVTSFDQTTRVSVIEAMTRTGIPPINPSYYPGHPVQLTFLYYFWYILCSMVDALGGKFVDARAALNASSAWAGIGLMVIVALYIQQRNANSDRSIWKLAKIGVGLLAVSGLDILPIVILMLRTGFVVGSIDVWNTWIPSWIASALWVPHHVASLLACLSAVMITQFSRKASTPKKYLNMTIAGFAFASALGLSIYVTIAFVVFWGIWIFAILLQKKDRGLILPMIYCGAVALLLAAPFLIRLFQGGSGGTEGSFPITFEVRTFLQLESFVKSWPSAMRSLIMFAVLPINYIFELGFFFLAGLYWFTVKDRMIVLSNPFYFAELLLLAVVILIGSFFRSTLITSNDLGWRVWLPGQFILLIWGVDVIEALMLSQSKEREAQKNRKLLLAFLSIGLITTIVDAALLRAAWPLMTGADETRRYYSAREAYEYLRDNVPSSVITQNNPLYYADRPSGLYGTHQMVVSDRTSYGVPLNTFNKLADDVGGLFIQTGNKDWQYIDLSCRKYLIDVLIIEREDPIWMDLLDLKKQRLPLYENSNYMIFACGTYK